MQNADTTLAIIRERGKEVLPHRHPRRETDADATNAGSKSRPLITGEPCAAKVASTVRGEAHGKGPQGTSPGAYPTAGRVGVVGPKRARQLQGQAR